MTDKSNTTQQIEDVASGASGITETKAHIHARTIIAVLAVCFTSFAQLMAVVGSGLLARDMAADLAAPTLSAWFASITVIMTLATILPVSQASDYWGRKVFILLSNAFGIVGFIIVSRSENIATCLAGFVLGGVAYACQALCYAIPSEVLHRKHRGWGQASVNVTGGLGALVGILVGGALTRGHTGQWRIYWYVCSALFALGLVGIVFGYNPPPRELEITLTTKEKLAKMDWIGSLLISVGLVLFVMGLQWSGNPYSWSNGHVLGPFISAICLLIAFGVWEWKGTSEGILHHSLFEHRNFALSILAIFFEGLTFFTVNNFFVFEINIVSHVDSFAAGFRFAVFFAAAILVAIITGAYITWAKQVREPIVCGFALLTIFCVLMVFYKASLPLANAYGYSIIGGFGLGLILTSALVAAQMSTPPGQISLGSGLPTAARSLGAAVGLAINSAIFNKSLNEKLPRMISEAVLALGFNPKDLGALIGGLASQNQAAVGAIPGITPEIISAAVKGLTEAYTESFRALWIAAACFAAVGIPASVLLTNPKLEFNEHIDAPAEAEVLRVQQDLEKRYHQTHGVNL